MKSSKRRTTYLVGFSLVVAVLLLGSSLAQAQMHVLKGLYNCFLGYSSTLRKELELGALEFVRLFVRPSVHPHAR